MQKTIIKEVDMDIAMQVKIHELFRSIAVNKYSEKELIVIPCYV